MPRSQLKILVALVTVLIIGGIGAFALSRPQPQIATIPTGAVVQVGLSNTPTEPKEISPETSAIMRSPTFIWKAHSTVVPVGTSFVIIVPPDATYLPTSTIVLMATRVGPTLTPSGPLIELTEAVMQRLKDRFPEKLGEFKFELNKYTPVGRLEASYSYGANQALAIEVGFFDTNHTADTLYNYRLSGGYFKNYFSVNIGDEALIAPNQPETLAIMRWRNSITTLVVISPSGLTAPALGADQIARILKSVVDALNQGVSP